MSYDLLRFVSIVRVEDDTHVNSAPVSSLIFPYCTRRLIRCSVDVLLYVIIVFVHNLYIFCGERYKYYEQNFSVPALKLEYHVVTLRYVCNDI